MSMNMDPRERRVEEWMEALQSADPDVRLTVEGHHHRLDDDEGIAEHSGCHQAGHQREQDHLDEGLHRRRQPVMVGEVVQREQGHGRHR